MAKKKKDVNTGVRIRNKRAFHDYHISEKLECGLALTGTEVKSLRAGQAKIDEGYVRIMRGELFLLGTNIAIYPQAGEAMQHDPTRKRKLLVHKRQIAKLEEHVKQKGKTIIPLAIYFTRGIAKCEIGIAQGKQHYDKRHSLREKQQKRDIARELKRF